MSLDIYKKIIVLNFFSQIIFLKIILSNYALIGEKIKDEKRERYIAQPSYFIIVVFIIKIINFSC